jgi:phosphogluconate dehydratase
MSADKRIEAITARIVERSKPHREPYLDRVRAAASKGVHRAVLSCGNLAHGFAVCSPAEKDALAGDRVANLGIITSYNDMRPTSRSRPIRS